MLRPQPARRSPHNPRVPTRLNILLGALFAALILALAWRGFVYHVPRAPVPAVPVAVIASGDKTPSTAAASDPQVILDLFLPTDSALQTQHSESQFKRQLEEAMTLMFVLRRCEHLSDRDYRETYQVLHRFARSYRFNNGQMLTEEEFGGIIASATDSYRLLYATVPCDSPNLAGIAAQLEEWRRMQEER